MAEAEENKLGVDSVYERFQRWHTCSLCEQDYHGVVRCALGWACWKTYVGRPDWARRMAIYLLGLGLSNAGHHEEALSVKEAEMSMLRRVGASEVEILTAQGNLASTYKALGRREEALRMERDVYSECLRLNGEEHRMTLTTANNYALSLCSLGRFEEAKSLFCKTIPVARRVLGNDRLTLAMRMNYAEALYMDDGAPVDDLSEAVNTLEDTERTARQVLGSVHPSTVKIERSLREARAALAARETSARMEEAPARVERVEEAPARLEEALARVDRLERELAEVQRQVAELMRTRADAEAPP